MEKDTYIYENILRRLFIKAHHPYTNKREYMKIALDINAILYRLKADYDYDHVLMIIHKISVTTNKFFGPLDPIRTYQQR